MAAVAAAIGVRSDSLRGALESLLRAAIDADPAAAAALAPVDLAWNVLPVFGIVTPPAAQRTSLQEHRGADAGAIVRRKPHDVEDRSDRRCAVGGGIRADVLDSLRKTYILEFESHAADQAKKPIMIINVGWLPSMTQIKVRWSEVLMTIFNLFMGACQETSGLPAQSLTKSALKRKGIVMQVV